MKTSDDRKTVETMQAELLEAFRKDAFPPDDTPPEAMSVSQYAAGIGVSYDLAANALQKLVKEGKWLNGKSRRLTAGGRQSKMTVYWPKP